MFEILWDINHHLPVYTEVVAQLIFIVTWWFGRYMFDKGVGDLD